MVARPTEPQPLSGTVQALTREAFQVPLPLALPQQPRRLEVHGGNAGGNPLSAAHPSGEPVSGSWPAQVLSFYHPSRAPGAVVKVPVKAAGRAGLWRKAMITRSSALDGVREARAAHIDVDALLGQLQRARRQEAQAWAATRCDTRSSATPTRLRDAGHGDPDGLQMSRPDWAIRERRTGREIGTLKRIPGGGYACTVQVELTGLSRGGVMEMARLVREIGR